MYVLFDDAQAMNKSVAELLTGKPQPLSRMEFYLRQRWKMARARFEQQSRPAGMR